MIQASEARCVIFREAPLHKIPGVNVLLIMGQRGAEALPIGSGVIIGPNLAICARHVIEAFYNELQPNEYTFEGRFGFKGNRESFFKPKFAILARLFVKYNSKPIIFSVETINCSLSDIVLLKLKPYITNKEVKLIPTKMQAIPPSIGSFIDAFGYVTEITSDAKRWIVKGYGSRGEIKDVLLNGRDSATLFFPVFQTNAHFAPSMSGGPVYSSEGVLCGSVCYECGVDIDNPEAEHVSFATALFPLLGCKVEMDLINEPPGLAYTIKELCQRKIVFIDGHELFYLGYDEDGWVNEVRATSAQINSRQW